MDTFFIGWSGNKPLADKLAKLIESKAKERAIVGGGIPKDMYIGSQVITQIQKCNRAILLVEDKDGQISPNLMFEWGYLMAKLSPKHIYTCLINKSSRDLPSDLLGTWVYEFNVDRSTASDGEIAEKIFEKMLENKGDESERNYFNSIDKWRSIFAKLSSGDPIPDTEMCHYIITGCFAAYYYMDYRALRRALNNIVGLGELASIVAFAKSYIDVFIESENMMRPLPEDVFARLSEDFEMILERRREYDEDTDLLVDILCYDVYGLACSLYLRNEGLEDDMIQYCSDKAMECFMKDLELIDLFEKTTKNNECLIQLIRAYIYNDLAHLYKSPLGRQDKFLEYLNLSVDQRQALYVDFTSKYQNPFLSLKLEQEYIIALSEQCIYLSNPMKKKLNQSNIKKKVTEWEKELRFTSSLTERIKANMEKF